MKKLSNNPKDWNIDKLKSKSLGWFKKVVNDYSERGYEKLTEDEIKKLYETLTGKKSALKNEEVKDDKSK